MFGAQRAEVGPRRFARLGRARALARPTGTCGWRRRLGGQSAEARVTGAYATRGRQHIDFDTTQEHAAPEHDLRPRVPRGAPGRSSAVWKGNIIVDPGAQKTDAFQESRNLLISKPRARGRDPRAGDPGQRRPLHARGGGRSGRSRAAVLSALARARGGGRQAPGDRGVPGRAGRALRAGPGSRAPRRRARTPPCAGAGRLALRILSSNGSSRRNHGGSTIFFAALHGLAGRADRSAGWASSRLDAAASRLPAGSSHLVARRYGRKVEGLRRSAGNQHLAAIARTQGCRIVCRRHAARRFEFPGPRKIDLGARQRSSCRIPPARDQHRIIIRQQHRRVAPSRRRHPSREKRSAGPQRLLGPW